MNNLLVNGDFQAPYVFPSEGHEDVRHVGPGGVKTMIRVPNIRVPTGWTAFTNDDETFKQIEMGLGDTPDRMFNGHSSVKWFKFGARHKAGLEQKVILGPGKYQFRGWAHGWSNHPSACVGHESCKNQSGCSVGAGFDPYYAEVVPGEKETGDVWKDGLLNMIFWLGVAFTGGKPSISGKSAHIYNQFHELPMIEFELAATTEVTCGIGCGTTFGFENSNVYVGELQLTKVEEIEVGDPRVDYDRTYLLLPPNATPAMMVDLALLLWDKRYTIGFSADDAGIGKLTNRNVIIVDPGAWLDDIHAFFDRYYPGVKYADYQYTNTSYLVKQCDPLYGNQKFGHGVYTYCAKGCFLCVIAMAMRIYGLDPAATCVTVNTIATPSGFDSEENLLWTSIYKCGLDISTTLDTNKVLAHLRSGKVVAAEVAPASLLHFVLVTKEVNGRYWMLDPWKGVEGWLDDYYIGVDSWRLLDKKTAPEPPPVIPARKTNGHISFHVQSGIGQLKNAITLMKPPVVKVTTSLEDYFGVTGWSPDTTYIYRRVDNNQWYLSEEDKMYAAREWIKTFKDALYIMCDRIDKERPGTPKPYFGVESLNETFCSLNAESIKNAANFDIAFIDALKELNLPIFPVVFTAAVGNPHPTEYQLLVPLAKKCADNKGIMGYHNYWYVNHSVSDVVGGWRDYAGRWTAMDEVFVANGIYVKWFGGESGAFESVNEGWRSPACWNGNWAKYLEDIMLVDQMIYDWNKTHGDRYLGLTLFTTGEAYTGWDMFQIKEAQANDIAKAIVARYVS